MAKNSIRDYSATASSNTDVQSVNIDENCPASGINNAIREVMVDLKNVSTGAIALETPAADSMTVSGGTNSFDTTGSVNGLQLYYETDAGLATIGSYSGGGSTNLSFHTNSGGSASTEAMRIDNSGNVGIGTTSPDHTLTVSAAASPTLEIEHTGGPYKTNIVLNGNDTEFRGSSGNIEFYTGSNDGASSTERMRIDSSGNLMIGTTNSQYNGIGASAALTSFNNGVRFGANFGASTTGTQYTVVFSNPNGQIGGILVSGSATSYVASSDYRLKTAVNYDWDATTRLKQLKPARFKWIADGDDAVEVDGFLAHEAQAIVPESVTGTKDEVEVWKDGEELPDGVSVGDNKLDEDSNTIPVMQGIDQAKLVPLLCKTILELEARITALEAG